MREDGGSSGSRTHNLNRRATYVGGFPLLIGSDEETFDLLT